MFFSFKKKHTIHLYTICWNEEYMLKYFFKHYDGLVDRYVIFDDGSTDRTLSILERHPKVETRPLPRLDGIDSYVLAAQKVHDNCWKESRGLAEWVIITAVDEFLYARSLKSYLADCAKKGVTALPALGFQMVSQSLPSSNRRLVDLVKRGCPEPQMNKLSLFNPNRIIETNQHVGRHAAGPLGEVTYPDMDVLLNLHYKYLSFEYTFQRHTDLQEKLGSIDKDRGWGIQYSWTRERFKSEWDYYQQNSVENVFSRAYNPSLEHSPLAERWWRKDSAAHQEANGRSQ